MPFPEPGYVLPQRLELPLSAAATRICEARSSAMRWWDSSVGNVLFANEAIFWSEDFEPALNRATACLCALTMAAAYALSKAAPDFLDRASTLA